MTLPGMILSDSADLVLPFVGRRAIRHVRVWGIWGVCGVWRVWRLWSLENVKVGRQRLVRRRGFALSARPQACWVSRRRGRFRLSERRHKVGPALRCCRFPFDPLHEIWRVFERVGANFPRSELPRVAQPDSRHVAWVELCRASVLPCSHRRQGKKTHDTDCAQRR